MLFPWNVLRKTFIVYPKLLICVFPANTLLDFYQHESLCDSFPFHNPHTDMTRREGEGMCMNEGWWKAFYFVKLLRVEKKAQNKQIIFIGFSF